jgi:hypothetical protein
MTSVVAVKTTHGQVYWYTVDVKSGKKTRISAARERFRAKTSVDTFDLSASPSARPTRSKASRRSPTREVVRGPRTRKPGSESKRETQEEEEQKVKEKKTELRTQIASSIEYDADRNTQRDRMAEHCTYVAAIVRLVGLRDAAGIVKRCLLLRTAWQDAETTDACQRIVPSMWRLKTDTLKELKRENARRCYVALLEHMLRELKQTKAFLEDSDYFRKRHAREHLAEFADEDAEAQLFVACDVPTLVNRPSRILDEVVRQNVDLALQLSSVAKRALATVDPEKGDLLIDVLPDYIKLRAKHVTSSRAFLRDVLPHLDMAAELAELIRQLVTHEIRESDWGFSIVERTITA